MIKSKLPKALGREKLANVSVSRVYSTGHQTNPTPAWIQSFKTATWYGPFVGPEAPASEALDFNCIIGDDFLAVNLNFKTDNTTYAILNPKS